MENTKQILPVISIMLMLIIIPILLDTKFSFIPTLFSQEGRLTDCIKEKLITHSSLHDPSSVMLRNITADRFGEGWCGELNAKNRYGGYTGWKYFHFWYMEETSEEAGEIRFLQLDGQELMNNEFIEAVAEQYECRNNVSERAKNHICS